MKKLAAIFICLLTALQALAQQEFDEPSRLITRFRFVQFTGGVVLLKAQLASFPDSLNFIFDTGSGGVSLDSTTVSSLGLRPEPSDRLIRGIAGVKKVGFLKYQRIKFPNLLIDSLDFHVNDYQILTNVYGERIDGIIGYSVMNRYIIKLNYDSSFIEFWSKGAFKYPKGGFLLKPLITSIPIQPVRVRDERTVNSRFLFDIGAGMNMILSNEFLQDSSLLSRKRKLYPKLAEGLGGEIEMTVTVIREVKLGPYRFKNVPVYAFDDTYNVTSYPHLGGIIGNDLLRRFNVVLNYEKREIYITPNSHYNEPFDYAYTGIELFYLENKVVIGDVAAGSPAEVAGLKEGDIVLAVDRNFSQSLQQYKAALQSGVKKMRMIVMRDNKMLDIELKPKNILTSR